MILLPKSTIALLATSANRAIEAALQHGSMAMRSPPRTEVGFVAAASLGGIPSIAHEWKKILKGCGLTLSLTGVFCHASPVVTFRNQKGSVTPCELADLLVVVDFLGPASAPRVRRAALIQAKMAWAKGRVLLRGSSSGRQLDLYQNWYRFDFVEDVYQLKNLNFHTGPGVSDSGTIGVIDRHWRPGPVWTQHQASPPPNNTVGHIRLGEFIAGMALGQTGRGRLATPSLNTDWSKTIEKLLTITYGRAFHHKPTLGAANMPRGTRAIACLNFATQAKFMRDIWGGQPPFDNLVIVPDDGQPSGISALHIKIGPIDDRIHSSRI